MVGQRRQTMVFSTSVCCQGWATVVGPMEGEGPFGQEFDLVLKDYLWGEKSWEKTECKMVQEAVKMAAALAGTDLNGVDLLLAGDLLNQTISSNYAASSLEIPLAGLYGACSTMAESLALGSALVAGGFYHRVACVAVSHHHTAERQYRFPTEQGVQRPLSAQWTVTGAGALVLGQEASTPLRLTSATLGQVIDAGQSDPNDMGSAMAPAAAHTLLTHLRETHRGPEYYDLIVTGDLGEVGLELFKRLCRAEGLELDRNCSDCGVLIYDSRQDVHAGASGCGCSAAMLGGPLIKRMMWGQLKRVLLIGTGALMSPGSLQQGGNIPAVAHAVALERVDS